MTKIIKENLKKGDVLLNEKHHTAIYIGDGKLVHASINEKGTISGGKTGDQTGKEICVRSYYDYPWDLVLRYPDETLASEAADLAVSIANDSSHGYDQIKRWTPDFDCSSLIIYCWQKIGVPVREAGATYTGNMNRIFKKCGFNEIETDQVATIYCNVMLPELTRGAKGQVVKTLQVMLNYHGFNCGAVDGSFGTKTHMAVLEFQGAKALSQDACVGPKTWNALLR